MDATDASTGVPEEAKRRYGLGFVWKYGPGRVPCAVESLKECAPMEATLRNAMR